MIVGKGLLAHAFESRFGDDPNVIVFASGVSNSLETSVDIFKREAELLIESLSIPAGRLVYFSSCGVADDASEQTPYMKHKKNMEALVLSSSQGMVLRLPQVVGATRNAHTLTNFLRDRIVSGEHFNIWSRAERNLIDIDDIVNIGNSIITEYFSEAKLFSIAAARSMGMLSIVAIFERILGKVARYSVEDKGAPMRIDSAKAQEVAQRLGIDLGDGYIEKVIRKYYTPT
jgi:hypothetical protein